MSCTITICSRLLVALFVALKLPNDTHSGSLLQPTINLWCIRRRCLPMNFTLMCLFQRLLRCLVIIIVESTRSNAFSIVGCVIQAIHPTTDVDSPMWHSRAATIVGGEKYNFMLETDGMVWNGLSTNVLRLTVFRLVFCLVFRLVFRLGICRNTCVYIHEYCKYQSHYHK